MTKPGTAIFDNKDELIASINKKLDAFPGIIFNYTQPAEDAVDEALTGLKSSLAVKIYGDDLNVLQDKAMQIKNTLANVPGFTDLTVVRELGQPSLLIDVDRDKIARYGINVADVEAVISGRRRRASRHAGHPGRKAVRPGGAHAAAVPQQRAGNWQSAGGHSRRPADSAHPAGQHQARETAHRSFTAKITPAISACSTALKAAIWQRAVEDGQEAVEKAVKLPQGYRLAWGGEYSQFLEARVTAFLHWPAGPRC